MIKSKNKKNQEDISKREQGVKLKQVEVSMDSKYNGASTKSEKSSKKKPASSGKTLTSSTTNTLVNIDYSKVKVSKTVPKNVKSSRGVLSIVNTKEFGKRISISKSIIAELDKPKTLQFGFSKRRILLSENLSLPDSPDYTVKYSKGHYIYSGGLVDEITEIYDLDFRNRTSISFPKVIYSKRKGHIVAGIKVR